MATNERISALTQLLTPATGDLFAIMDVSEPNVDLQTKMITLGTIDGRYVLESGDTMTGKLTVSGEVEIDGALNHDGTTAGFYGTAPVTQPAAVANATGAGDVVAQLNALLDRMRSLGLIAT